MANRRTMDLICSFEGFHKVRRGEPGLAYPYPDAGYGWRVTTQGYGTTIHPETSRKLRRDDPPIDKETALRWLQSDIERKYEPKVRALVKVPLSEDSMGALISFAYNCGPGALARSTLLKRVNNRQWSGVPEAFERYKYSNGKVFAGLLRRRRAEAKQFMEGLREPSEGDITPPAVPPLPTRKPAVQPSSGFLRAITGWFTGFFR